MRNRLVLVLGAGVSSAFGLPLWDELTKQLYFAQGKKPPTSMSLPQKFGEYKHRYYRNDQAGFIAAVHRALYRSSKVDAEALRANATLAAIGSLVNTTRRGCISHIVSFNYDDLIERYLGAQGAVVYSAVEQYFAPNAADVIVYHPHGFIPWDGPELARGRIVVTQEDYNQITGADGNAWRQLLVTLLRTNFCLFIGIAPNDANLASLLVRVRDWHGLRREATSAYWGIAFNVETKLRNIWGDMGVYLHRVADYDKALPALLYSICQDVASLRSERA